MAGLDRDRDRGRGPGTNTDRSRRWGESLRCAWAGLLGAVRAQRNLRIQMLIGALAFALALALGLDALRLAVLTLTIVIVLALELVNTALEALVDGLYPRAHPLARRVKDVAAGAVLLAALGAAATGLWLFGELLWTRLH